MLGVRFYVDTPAANAPAIPGLVPLGSADLSVQESRTAWPRAFFTDRVARYGHPRELMELVKHANSVPLAAVERGAPLPAAMECDADKLAGRAVVEATDYRLTPNTTSFRVNAGAPGIVVLGEAFEHGNYAVTVNGENAEPLRVNHAFLGVLVNSAGPHAIVFTYRPRLWRLSLCIAAFGLVLAISAAIFAARRKQG
jgi:hypothetical protein